MPKTFVAFLPFMKRSRTDWGEPTDEMMRFCVDPAQVYIIKYIFFSLIVILSVFLVHEVLYE